MGNVTAKTSGEIANFMSPAKTNIKSLKVHFSPKQLGTGDPSPENIREIVGWDGVEACQTSINLLDQSYITSASGWILSSDDGNTTYCGVPVYKGNVNKFYTKFKSGYPFIGNPFKENVQYNVSVWLKTVSGNSIQGLKFGFKYTDGTTSLGGIFSANDTWKRQTVTSKANKTVSGIYCSYNSSGEIYLCGLAVCEKELDNTSVVYPSAVNNISIDWLNDIGTIYGGYVDLISGELVEEYSYLDLNNLNWDVTSQVGVFRSNDLTNYYVSSITNFICNKYITTSHASTSIASMQDLNIKAHDVNDKYIYIKDTSYTDVAEFKSSLIDCNMVYLLATPITHQLTPTQLSSSIGQNNFWSNADYVEVEYELKETEDIQKARKKIILNQPHIESVKDDIANFTTNMKAPLKECKVYFEPIQEGEGDPSPDNIRPINGWTGVNIYDDPKYGGNIVWNQLYHGSGSTGTNGGITYTKLDNGTWEIKGTSDTTSGTAARRRQIQSPSWEANHIYWFSARAVGDGTQYLQMVLSNSGSIKTTTTLYDGAFAKPTEKINQFSFRVLTKDITVDAIARPQIIDLTMLFGEETADYIYNLEKSKSGAGKEYFFNLFPKDWYEYNAGEATTVSAVNGDQYTSIPINWTDEVGTVYGGYIDLVTGELVGTHTYQTFDGDEPWSAYGSDVYRFALQPSNGFPKKKNGQDNVICDSYSAHGYNSNYYVALSGTQALYPTAQDLKDALSQNPIHACYELLEPVRYQLTPQQILTFKGTNNIWSNSNGQTEVKFWTH